MAVAPRRNRAIVRWIVGAALVGAGLALAQSDLVRAPGDPGSVIGSQPLGMPGQSPESRVGAPFERAPLVLEGTLLGIDASTLQLEVPGARPVSIAWDEDTLLLLEGEPVTFDLLPSGAPVRIELDVVGNRRRASRVEVVAAAPSPSP